ncbi:MAG: hypothetical protein U9R15_10545, partial [Chloroflexota bacterium]|nr:hypothetical protein [Chloroflexota bacterium]
LVGDGSYAAVALVQYCQRRKQPVKLVSRLRLDARLFDFPGPHVNQRPKWATHVRVMWATHMRVECAKIIESTVL